MTFFGQRTNRVTKGEPRTLLNRTCRNIEIKTFFFHLQDVQMKGKSKFQF